MTPPAAAAAPTLSVVIPTYRRAPAALVGMVRAIAIQAPEEIVVTVDGPDAAVVAALRSVDADPRPIVVELPCNQGAALARRAGAAAASGDVLLFLDDDIRPAPDLVDRHRRAHAATPDLVLVGCVETPVPPPGVAGAVATRLFVAEHEQAMQAWRRDPELVLHGMYGGLVSVARWLFDAAEAVLPTVRLDYYEDLDLGLRLAAAGGRGRFDPEPGGVHDHAKSPAAMLREARARGATRAALAARWGAVPAAVHTDTHGWRLVARRAVAGAARVPGLAGAACRTLEWGLAASGRRGWARTELLTARLARTLHEEVGAVRGG